MECFNSETGLPISPQRAKVGRCDYDDHLTHGTHSRGAPVRVPLLAGIIAGPLMRKAACCDDTPSVCFAVAFLGHGEVVNLSWSTFSTRSTFRC